MPALDAFNPRDVICVQPNPLVPPCAEKFLPVNGLLTLLGDENNDSSIWEDQRPGAVDALQWRPGQPRRTARHLYFSTSTDIDDCISAGGDFHDGDIGRIEADGKFVFFLTEDQIRSAFGMPTDEEINVDAFTLDEATQRCYLSFEDAEVVDTVNAGVVNIEDGAVVCIPLIALGEPSTVAANSGLLVAHEAQVDNMVANSAVWDRSSNPAVSIGDLDGLEIDTGFWGNVWGNWEQLLLRRRRPDRRHRAVDRAVRWQQRQRQVDERHRPGPSRQHHARPPGRVVRHGAERPAASTPSSRPGPGRPATSCSTLRPPKWSAARTRSSRSAGASPGGAWLLLGVDADAPCIVHPIMATLPNPCFPDLMTFQGAFGPMPINAAGFGQRVIPIPMISGFDLVFQGVGAGPMGFELSTPITIEIL